jgi:hypothetical protein
VQIDRAVESQWSYKEKKIVELLIQHNAMCTGCEGNTFLSADMLNCYR